MYMQLKNQKYRQTAIKTNVSESTLKENVKLFDLLLVSFSTKLFRLFENKMGSIIKSMLQKKFLYFIFTSGIFKNIYCV